MVVLGVGDVDSAGRENSACLIWPNSVRYENAKAEREALRLGHNARVKAAAEGSPATERNEP